MERGQSAARPRSDPPDGSWVSHRWPQAPQTARTARRHLRAALAATSAGRETQSYAELVMAELVANAVQHGTADDDGLIEVSWCVCTERLLLSVHDSGHVSDLRPGDLGSAGASGRGLALIAAISTRWCWEGGDGTRVGAELPLT